jgi:hypothetical protein
VVSAVAVGEVAAVDGTAAVAEDAKAHREIQSAARERPLPRRRAAPANSQPAQPPTAHTSTIMSRPLRESRLLRRQSHESRGKPGSRGNRARHPPVTRSPPRLLDTSSLHRRRKATQRAKRSRMWCGHRLRPIAPPRAAAAGPKNN